MLTAENNVMRLLFFEADSYLIANETGAKISKDYFYSTRVLVPRQIPDDALSRQME